MQSRQLLVTTITVR